MFSNPMIIGTVFSSVWFLLAVPAGVFLVLSYLKTRMSGFMWLLGSVVIWPFIHRGLTLTFNMAAPALQASHGWSSMEFINYNMFLALGGSAFGGLLLLISCIILYREILQRLTPPTPPPPPAI